MTKKSNTIATIRRLLGYVSQHWYLVVLAIALTIISNQLSLLGPKYSGDAIDAIAKKGGVDFTAVGEYVVKMLFCYIVSAVLSYLLSVLMIHISQKVVYKMRRQVFDKIMTLPVSFFDKTKTGDVISRISHDVDTVNSSLSYDLVAVMSNVYAVVGAFIFMWNLSKPLILVLVVTVPLSIWLAKFCTGRVRPLYQVRSKKIGELNGYAEEMLSGCHTIQIYHREEEIEGQFNEKNHEAMDAYHNADHTGAVLSPVLTLVNNVSKALFILLGGILYMLSMTGRVTEASLFFITLGGITQFIQYAEKFAGPINEFGNIIHDFQTVFAAAERVFAILDEEPEAQVVPEEEELMQVQGNVTFDNVFFSYTPDQMILKGISMKATPGKTIAIVGPTGAGKTTIINLLMRFYDTVSGDISIEEQKLTSLKRESLRKAYTMVLQDTWLFHGTVFDNIAYGKEGATLEEVKKAAKAAKIDWYIERLPDGYDTILSDDGSNISKGQKQLITIARAMLSDAPMLILDEATSNVDSRTEIQIQKALAELMEGRTSFVIAHRLSTIQNADLIIVLQNGEISEQGTHDELMRCGGFYSKLYNSQFE